MQFTALYSSSEGNLYRVDSPQKRPLLIECGVPMAKLMRAVEFNLSSFAGCLLSHGHVDHSAAARELVARGIDVWCSAETADYLGLFVGPHDGSSIQIIRPYTMKAIDSWKFIAFPTEHDCPGSLGFVVSDGTDKLLFATDTHFIHQRFTGPTILAIECNWSVETMSPDIDPAVRRRLVENHMSLATVKDFLTAQDLRRVREIHLLHLSDRNSDSELFKRKVQGWTGKPVYVAQKNPTIKWR